jgi:hypothetical protein
LDVAGGRQPGADIEELPDAGLFGQVFDRPAKERAVLARSGADRGESGQYLVRGFAVGREVILPAWAVVVHRAECGRDVLISGGSSAIHVSLSPLIPTCPARKSYRPRLTADACGRSHFLASGRRPALSIQRKAK